MKTSVLSFVLILILAFSSHGKPINDIYSVNDPVITEESYIDDIPFNTWEIAVQTITDGDEVKLEEEPYIDDIPFDTRAIADKYLLNQIMKTSSEKNVNDIPFNTEKIMNDYLTGEMTENYKDEENVADLPQKKGEATCLNEKTTVTVVTFKVKTPRKVTLRNNKGFKTEYTIRYPELMEVPRIEWKCDPATHELRITPSSSL